VRGLAVRTEIRATRLPRYAKWLQLERRLVSEIVGVGCLIHIPSVSLDVLWASLKFFVEEDILLMNKTLGPAELYLVLQRWDVGD
jgi:hypothetical protein